MNVPLLFSHLVVSSSLWPHGLQHTRLPSPSLTTWACSNSWPLSWWYHSTISSSVAPFSSCPQSFPASGSFPMSWLFPSGGQSIGASASVLPMNIQGWFPLGLIGLICLLSKGLSRVFSSESALCIRWPKYWSFSISPPYEYSGLISLRIDCIDLLAVQGTLKSLLQHEVRSIDFFSPQLSL